MNFTQCDNIKKLAFKTFMWYPINKFYFLMLSNSVYGEYHMQTFPLIWAEQNGDGMLSVSANIIISSVISLMDWDWELKPSGNSRNGSLNPQGARLK